jgi:hypothetical protein
VEDDTVELNLWRAEWSEVAAQHGSHAAGTIRDQPYDFAFHYGVLWQD